MKKSFADFGIDTKGRTSGHVKTPCPQCSHTRRHPKDACLSVNVDEGVWKCHHCGWSGHLGFDGSAAYARPRREYVAPSPDALASGVVIGSIGHHWLTVVRDLSAQAISAAGVAVDNKEVRFPYYVDGQLVNIKTRSIADKRFRMEKDARLVWYGIDWCKNADTVYVVEGEIDALTLRSVGVDAVLSCPNGAPPVGTAPNLDYFTSAAHVFERATRVIMAGDADAPGQSLIAELVRRIGIEKCSRVEWDDGIKDANECLTKAGPVYLKACLDSARPYPIAGIIDPLDERHEVLRLYREGMPRGLGTGYPSLDALFSVVPGGFTVVTGIPGSGKSEFLDNVAINIAREHGWKWAVFSPEGAPTPAHMGRVIEKYAGKPFFPSEAAHSGIARLTEAEVEAAADWVDDHFRWFVPEEPTVDELLRLARIDVLRRGTKGIIIDPWNEIQHARPNGMREDEYLSEQLRKIRQFAERHACHVFIVNHPHAMAFDPSTGQYPVVKGYDLNGGAMWLNKTSSLLSVWRDAQEPNTPVKVYVLKVKTRQIGRRGSADLWFQRPTGRYQDSGRYEVAG